MSVTEPIVTRHDDGRLTVEWPDPPRPSYEVSHEVIQMFVDAFNDRRARDEAVIQQTWKLARPKTASGAPAVIARIIAAVDKDGTP